MRSGRSRPISAVDSGSILNDAEGDGVSGVGSYRGLGLDSVGSRTHFAGGHGGRLLHGFDPVHHGARREDRRRAQLQKCEAPPTPLLPRGRCHGTDCRRMCTGSTCTRLLNRQVQVLRRVPPREDGGSLQLRQASSAIPRDRSRAGLAKPSPSDRKHSTVRRTPAPVGKKSPHGSGRCSWRVRRLLLVSARPGRAAQRWHAPPVKWGWLAIVAGAAGTCAGGRSPHRRAARRPWPPWPRQNRARPDRSQDSSYRLRPPRRSQSHFRVRNSMIRLSTAPP